VTNRHNKSSQSPTQGNQWLAELKYGSADGETRLSTYRISFRFFFVFAQATVVSALVSHQSGIAFVPGLDLVALGFSCFLTAFFALLERSDARQRSVASWQTALLTEIASKEAALQFLEGGSPDA